MRFLLLSLILLLETPTTDDFIPSDIGHAVALGCTVAGVKDSPPFAEVQVLVKYDSGKPSWDFHPIMARYSGDEGGVLKATEECEKWYRDVRRKIEEFQKKGDKRKGE